ncbi:MAG: MBOAT family O-acyltransferase [Bdellovibrionota bacterium]
MTFTDVSFFVYLALCLVIFRITPLRSRWIFLIVAGVVFYAFLDVRFLWALLIMIAPTYAGCWYLARFPRHRLWMLWLAVGAVLSWLFLIKWSGTNAISWLGPPLSLLPGARADFLIGLAFPIGISFHALQCVSVLVDTYRNPATWDPHPGRMILFLCYLPQILAGPIERARVMSPQFIAPKQESPSEALQGLEWFTRGLFKKFVIADRFAPVLGAVVAQPLLYQSPLVSALVIFGFPIYLYMDFSGYTDLARGMSLWFGIRLSKNFDAPFASKTTAEIWRRWHITFHNFVRDYVLKSLKGYVSSLGFRLFIAFTLSGLWHGLGLHFFAWSMAALAIVILEELAAKVFSGYKSMPLAPLRTYLLVSISCAFFYVPDLATLPELIRGFTEPLNMEVTLSMLKTMGWVANDLVIYASIGPLMLLIDGRDFGSRKDLWRWVRLVLLVIAILILRFPKGTIHSYFRI